MHQEASFTIQGDKTHEILIHRFSFRIVARLADLKILTLPAVWGKAEPSARRSFAGFVDMLF
jgi:hypothetical protein